MTPELIGALVGLLIALTGLVKVYTEVIKIKSDRAEVKAARDQDSKQLHDDVLKQGFLIQAIKDKQQLHDTLVSDMQEAINALNTNTAKLSVVVDNLADAIKEMKIR